MTYTHNDLPLMLLLIPIPTLPMPSARYILNFSIDLPKWTVQYAT
jgi:hypothetical protein